MNKTCVVKTVIEIEELIIITANKIQLECPCTFNEGKNTQTHAHVTRRYTLSKYINEIYGYFRNLVRNVERIASLICDLKRNDTQW